MNVKIVRVVCNQCGKTFSTSNPCLNPKRELCSSCDKKLREMEYSCGG